MAGVILYADDHINSSDRPENALFEELRKDIPVLGVDKIDFVEESTKAIGSFRALILDWEFENEDDFSDIEEEIGLKVPIEQGSVKENETLAFLNNNDFYSLIYIFSQKNVEESGIGEKLKKKFGDRVRFKLKDESFTKANVGQIKTEILEEISEWEKTNRNLSAPIKWSEAINKSVQKVFKELSEATDNWLQHIYDSANSDGVDPELFVIELMQLLLSENLVQNKELIKTIGNEGKSVKQIEILEEDESAYNKSIAKLFSVLSYSSLAADAPIMTGDVCKIKEGVYGVIITPECDIRHIKNDNYCEFEFLLFNTSSFKSYLQKEKSFNKAADNFDDLAEKRQKSLRVLFNQNEPRLHFLPSLPIDDNYNHTSVIDFRISTRRIKSKVVKKMSRPFKINSPFIQQIRQRNLAYIGRVGVPSLPNNVRDHNLK